jgi:hypothetical protein
MRFEARSVDRLQAMRDEFEKWLLAQGVAV